MGHHRRSNFASQWLFCLVAMTCACEEPTRDMPPPPPPLPPVECDVPLAGTTAFGQTLRGTTSVSLPSGRRVAAYTLAFDVYFPGGRVSGQPVVFAAPITPPTLFAAGLATDTVVLDDTVSAREVTILPNTNMSIRGFLAGPSGGFRATVRDLFDGPGLAEETEVTFDLCPAGAIPIATIRWSEADQPFGPTTPFMLIPTSPVGVADIEVMTSDGSAITVDVGVTEQELLLVQARDAWPPGRALSISLSGVRDAIGRELIAEAFARPPLQTTAIVSDLTFATPPPPGSVASAESHIEDGTLVVTGDALVALGMQTPAAAIRLTGQCRPHRPVQVSLVDALGRSTAFGDPCGESTAVLDTAEPVFVAVREGFAYGIDMIEVL